MKRPNVIDYDFRPHGFIADMQKYCDWIENNFFYWQELTPDNLPQQETWIIITDGIGFEKVWVTNQFEFVRNKDDVQCYTHADITHWCAVRLPQMRNAKD